MGKAAYYEVKIGESHVSIQRQGRREVAVGIILGREVQDGRETLWLDRMLVSPFQTELDGTWTASGAVSTVLSRSIQRD